MALEILIEPEGAEDRSLTITGVLWTTGADPQLIEIKTLESGAELRSWLEGIVVMFGTEDLAVRWTDKLKADQTLTDLVAACLDTTAP
jgi:hypothetical protein